MDAKSLIKITKSTVAEVDRILRMDKFSYEKEFGCESDRVPYAKIEKVTNMMSTLNFFINQYDENESSGCSCKEKTETHTPLYENQY